MKYDVMWHCDIYPAHRVLATYDNQEEAEKRIKKEKYSKNKPDCCLFYLVKRDEAVEK